MIYAGLIFHQLIIQINYSLFLERSHVNQLKLRKFLVAENEKKGKGTKQLANVAVKKTDPSYLYYVVIM